MKRPFTNYLKLLRKFLSTDKFIITKDDCYRSHGYGLVYESERIIITEEESGFTTRRKRYTVNYGTGEIKFYAKEVGIQVTLRTFQKQDYTLRMILDINGKDEFFNYIMQHDVDYLTYEDLEVLKEIKNLTLKITQKETING